MPDIDPTPLEKSFVIADGQRIAYHERGTGETVVFLHGNPTSSYLWRNVIPHVEPDARCLAPDLIGMGDSSKLDDPGPGSYRFGVHRRYLDAWMDAVYPGALLTGEQRERVRAFPNQTEVTVAGSHFVQEDSPHEIGQAIADWLPIR